MKFSVDITRRLMEIVSLMSREKAFLQVWYLKAIQALIDEGVLVYSCDIETHAWQEVDFPGDYKEACQNWTRYNSKK